MIDRQTTKRAGWVRRGVSDPESIADHMYRMSVMALIAPDVPGADRDRLVPVRAREFNCKSLNFFLIYNGVVFAFGSGW